MRGPRILPPLVEVGIGMLCAGCGTLPSDRGWGADATVSPGWLRIREAATSAAKDPWVWAPLTAAAVLQIDDFDRRTSDWARDHINKAKGAAVEVAAVSATTAAAVTLKGTTDRERPNGADRESFPSGHASTAAVHGELAKRNLDSIDMPQAARLAGDIGIDVVVAGTAWARVEAGWHYPSDTLVGIALGTFLGSFVTRAFLSEAAGNSLSLAATNGGAVLQWQVRF